MTAVSSMGNSLTVSVRDGSVAVPDLLRLLNPNPPKEGVGLAS